MRRRHAWLLSTLLLAACGTSEAGRDDVDGGAIEAAAAAEDLPAALEAGTRIVDGLVDELAVDERPRDDVRPYRVSRCDETADDGPHVVSVGRGIAFPSDTTDDLLEAAHVSLEQAGVEGLRTVGGDGFLPQLTGLFDDDRWQVAVTLNRDEGIGEVRVNSRCLPGEVPEPPPSS